MAKPIRRPIIPGVDNSHEYWPDLPKRESNLLSIAVALLSASVFVGLFGCLFLTDTGNMLIDSVQRYAASFRAPNSSTPAPIVFAALDALVRLCGVK